MISIAQLPFLFYKNRRLMENSKNGGCVKCLEIINNSEIVAFTDKEQTCICPKCGHDTLIFENNGYEITKEGLQKANKLLFKKN